MSSVVTIRDEARAAEDAGLFGPASEAWRLDREAMLLLGAGPRALLMQIAHPSVAAARPARYRVHIGRNNTPAISPAEPACDGRTAA